MRGYVYILKCADGTFYTRSTNNLERRILEHQEGKGANYTRSRLPVELVYFEEYPRIDGAFYREKELQRWSHQKKEALIRGDIGKLKKLSRPKNNKT